MKLIQDANIGPKIQELRIERNLTQVQVVALLQLRGSTLSETAYSKLEGGHRNLFIKDLVRLKEIFHVEYNVFFIDVEKECI